MTKIEDLAGFDHQDEIDFENLEDDTNLKINEASDDELESEFEDNSSENLDFSQDSSNLFTDSPTEINEIQSFDLKDSDSFDLSINTDESDEEEISEFEDMAKEVTTIEEINTEIEKEIQPTINIKEPINANISRNVPLEASPSYSLEIFLHEKKYQDDVYKIITNFGLNEIIKEKNINTAFNHGSLLIPRISEHMGILMIHSFRSLGFNFKFGLSEDIHKGEHDQIDRGSIFTEEEIKNKVKEILVSKKDHIDGVRIKKLGSLISVETFADDNDELDLKTEISILTESLKLKAIRFKADALVGLNQQTLNHYSKNKVKILVSGTLAWIK